MAIVLLAVLLILFMPGIGNETIVVDIARERFSETAAAIDNPDRGMYSVYGFFITDREMDYQAMVDQMIGDEETDSLTMIQINLAHYADRALTAEALCNIDSLFSALRIKENDLIVRFVYDWNGNAQFAEPEKIEIILNHMAQLKDVLQKNQDQIFVLQGLFTGKWGEMNGTAYDSPEELKRLSEMLMRAAGESTFLAVRTCAQWRNITGISETEFLTDGNVPRIGLYNDGMLGNDTDCGSYNPSNLHDSDPMAYWSREKELEFQDVLCRYVPNGGEVIMNNPLNDFHNAVAAMKTMHVTYLNRDYDQDVLNKWAAVTVEKGVYSGMDGLTYMERHLGYRILIKDAKLAYHAPRKTLVLDVDLKNVGFAPVYSEKDLVLRILDENDQLVLKYVFPQDIRLLYGGNHSDELMELHHEIQMSDLPAGEYTVYLAVCDRKTGELLVLANEQTLTQYGYKLAVIKRS